MSDTEFFLVCSLCMAAGYLSARLMDAVRAAEARQNAQEARRRAFLDARRPTLHPSRMAQIQDLAELDDLRDYIRRDDAGA